MTSAPRAVLVSVLLHLVLHAEFFSVYGILGGYNIEIEEAPYQINYGDVCGGVLITDRWAMTTAHCGTDSTYIRVGSKYRLRGRKVKIFIHIVHPLFGRKHEFDYDLQLLKTFRSLKFSNLIQPIAFCDGECGNSIYVSGWGYPMEKGEYQDILQQVKLKSVPMWRCQKVNQSWYNNTLTNRMFCAGGGSQDACQGDSGGAAVAYGRLVGLSTFGYGCGRNIPGVYLNVSEPTVRKWIRRHTEI